MLRAAKIGGAAVIVAAAGWGALWLTGRGEILARLDLERSRLAAQGIEITHGEPRIGGFPVGYVVELPQVAARDRALGLSAELPQVVAEAGLGAPDRIVYRLPQRFTAEIGLADAPGGQPEGGARALSVEFEAEELVVEQQMSGELPASLTLRAGSLLAVHAAEAPEPSAAVELAGLEATLDLPRTAQGGETALRVAVASLDYLATATTETGAPTRLEGGASRLALTASTDQRTPAAMLAVLAGAPGGGRFAATLQTGATRIEGEVGGDDPARSGRVAVTSGASGGVLAIENGRLALSGTSENNRFELAPADPAVRLRGAAVVDRIETVYRSPLVPAEAMDELAFRVALGRIAPDEALWQAIDPEGELVRAPGEVILDLIGSARMLADEATGLPGQAELGNLTLRHADVSLLGSSAELRGDIEFSQPANRPTGQLTLTLNRSMELVAELVRAGLIDIGAAQAVTATAANLTRPGDTPQTLLTEIEFEDGEARINGEPAWFFGGGAQ
ncbi:DUF2125 domain-containing protein [Limibaculum sp. FT325]|uniref:DUF2125 domain-containing protein n=1 Tax=Thermohalobaculum sediminis TaxID=2939436 RepID=UPI0020BDD496|nr:DUF2125 domain-containing protein [Limibaculum sediminis]MCL5776792.1 DUF2125 domain-containing protein [Limibaculum sediminis]